MKPSPLDFGLKSKSAHKPWDQRYPERVPIHYRAMYTGADCAGLFKTDGALRDLSKTGWNILGTTPPMAGGNLTLTLNLAQGQIPLYVTDATVSWIETSMFTVIFPKLTEKERKRIQQVSWKHVSLSPTKNQRAAFRIVS